MTFQQATAEEIQEVFQEVLAAPEFTSPAEAPLVQLLRWLWEGFVRVWEWLFPGGAFQDSAWVTWGLLALLLVGVAVLAAGRMRKGREAAPRRAAAAPPPRDAAAWLRWARERSAEGALRAAATGVYQAVLHHLAAEGSVRYKEWKTPGDYLDEMRRDARRGPSFAAFLRTFVPLAFGPVPPVPEGLRELESRARELGLPVG